MYNGMVLLEVLFVCVAFGVCWCFVSVIWCVNCFALVFRPQPLATAPGYMLASASSSLLRSNSKSPAVMSTSSRGGLSPTAGAVAVGAEDATAAAEAAAAAGAAEATGAVVFGRAGSSRVAGAAGAAVEVGAAVVVAGAAGAGAAAGTGAAVVVVVAAIGAEVAAADVDADADAAVGAEVGAEGVLAVSEVSSPTFSGATLASSSSSM